MNGKRITILLLISLALLALPAVSCSFSNRAGAVEPGLTLTSMSAAIIGTATADAAQGDEAEIELATAEANATATVQAIQATQAARQADVDVNQYATATIAAPILAELPFYGIHDNLGYVGWMTGTQTLSVEGYQQADMMVAPVTAADFVLASDITWNTQYGSSGCGFLFRADGDRNQPNTYMVIITRFATGHMMFTALRDGELANIHEFYPGDEDRSFNERNQSTNRLAVVARGDFLEFYTNMVKVGELDVHEPPERFVPPGEPKLPFNASAEERAAYQQQAAEYEGIVTQFQTQFGIAEANYKESPAIFTEGFAGLVVASESGLTECTFGDTWLWIITTQP